MEYNVLFDNEQKCLILSRVLAHLIGDGCVTNKYFVYTNKNQCLLNLFEKDIINLFGEIHITKGKYSSGTSLVQVQNKKIILFLKSLVESYKSPLLSVPLLINNDQRKKEFLKAIFDDEGSVGFRVFKKTNEIKRNVTLSSNSSRLLNEIKLILKESFSIDSNKLIIYKKRVGNKLFINYVLSITGKDNFLKFQKNINFYHPDKIIKLDAMIKSYIKK